MLRLNRIFSVLALSAAACGGQSQEPATPPQNIAPAEEPTGATTPGIGAATTDPSSSTSSTTTSPATSGESSTQASAAPKMAPPNDAQIALVVDLANKGEIEQAKIAQGRAKNARVKKFANMMINEHGKTDKEHQKLMAKTGMKHEESMLSSQFASDGATQLSMLKDSDAAAFDRTYIDGQVDVHAKLLDALDTQLIPNTTNEELKAHLTKVRTTVEGHLKEARDIQQALASGTTGQGSGAASSHGSHSTTSGASMKGSGSGTGAGTTGSSGTSGQTGNKAPAQ